MLFRRIVAAGIGGFEGGFIFLVLLELEVVETFPLC
jgi:hypothetical protein